MIKFSGFLSLAWLLLHGTVVFSQDRHAQVLAAAQEMVGTEHFAPREVNDAFGRDVANNLLDRLDFTKSFFTEKDSMSILSLSLQIDDELLANEDLFLQKVIPIYTQAIDRAERIVAKIFTQENDFNNAVATQNEFAGFATDKSELESRWAQKVQMEYLKVVYSNSAGAIDQVDDNSKERARMQCKAYFERWFEQTRRTHEELFANFVDSYLGCHDYQSTFFSQEEMASWNDEYNRSFVGVGIGLQIEGVYPEITKVYAGGPIWKSKKINEGDKIIAIGKKDEVLKNLANLPMEQVLKMLKGEAGSELTIQVQNLAGELVRAEIVRGEVPLQKVVGFEILPEREKTKYGYINIPRFYHTNGGCSVEVQKALAHFKKEGIESLVMDLRDNRGGAVSEAVAVMSMFLKGGPVMYAHYNEGRQKVLEDADSTAFFTGDLIVLVNGGSSSASELFSATIQDHNRGVILGQQTFGKGTIQRFFPIGQEGQEGLGEVKLSIGSFFSASGRSTQYHGVIPDIRLLDRDKTDYPSERSVGHSLRFDSLKLEGFSPENYFMQEDMAKLEKAHADRQAKILNSGHLLMESEAQSTPLELKAYFDFRNAPQSIPENTAHIPYSIRSLKATEIDEINLSLLAKLSKDQELQDALLILEDLIEIN